MSTKTLEQRIADAFSTSNITSHTLNQLLGETETAITAADADAFKMKSRRSIRRALRLMKEGDTVVYSEAAE